MCIRDRRRLAPDVPIVIGGIHATAFDQYLLERFPIDYAIRGEGEVALPALCDALQGKRSIESVPNLSWKRSDKKIVRNKVGSLLAPSSIAQTALPAYDLLPAKVYKALS